MFFHSFSLFVHRGSSSGKRILAASAFSATLAHRHGAGSPGRRCGRRQLPARRAAQQRLAAVPKGTSTSASSRGACGQQAEAVRGPKPSSAVRPGCHTEPGGPSCCSRWRGPDQGGRRWRVQVDCPFCRSTKDFKDVVTLGRRSDMCRHWRWQICRFGPQNRGLVRCGRMTVAEGTWRHHETYVEAKRRCEGGVSVRWSSKNLDGFIPEGI